MQPIPYTKQQVGEPLFPKLLYNRPISRHGAGRLLIVGGRPSYVGEVQAAYALATAAGIGECRVALPDSLVRLVGPSGTGEFVPSGHGGVLAKISLAELLALLQNYDAACIGPSTGHNSETTLLLESLLQKSELPMIITGDGLVGLGSSIQSITQRPLTTVVCTMPELFKLAGKLGVGIQITAEGGLRNKVQIVADVAAAGLASLVVTGPELISVEAGETTVTTITGNASDLTPGFAGVVASLLTQNPNKRQEAVVSACYLAAIAMQYLEEDREAHVTTNFEMAVARALRTIDDQNF